MGKKLGNINSDFKRKDLLLPVNDCKKFIKEVYLKIKTFCDVLVPNAKIVECSSLISYPGCYPQIWHTDTHYRNNEANLISFGITLEDIDVSMGPLEIFLESNKVYKNIDNLINQYKIKPDNLKDEIHDGILYQKLEKI